MELAIDTDFEVGRIVDKDDRKVFSIVYDRPFTDVRRKGVCECDIEVGKRCGGSDAKSVAVLLSLIAYPHSPAKSDSPVCAVGGNGVIRTS